MEKHLHNFASKNMKNAQHFNEFFKAKTSKIRMNNFVVKISNKFVDYFGF